MGLGDSDLLDIIIVDFGGDLNVKAAHGIQVQHFAAQQYTGYLSLLLMKTSKF